MAACSRTKFVFILLVFPAIALAYRPFDIPKNLFTSGIKDAHLPEGTRQISWRQPEDQGAKLKYDEDLFSDPEDLHFSKRRVRRGASADPEVVQVFF